MSQPPVPQPTSKTRSKIVRSGCSGNTPPMLSVVIWSKICKRASSPLLERSSTKYVLASSRRESLGLDMVSCSLPVFLLLHRSRNTPLLPLYLNTKSLSRDYSALFLQLLPHSRGPPFCL